MERRKFIEVIAGGLLAAPLAVEAQQPGTVWRIGYLGISRPPTYPDPSPNWTALLDGLRERGWTEGRNIVIERRYTEGRSDRAAEYAAQLVALKVNVILAAGAGALAAAKETRTIPIVFAGVTDPVTSALVASLARPGGNLTGFSITGVDLSPKRLELLRAAVPGATRVTVLGNPGNDQYPRMRDEVEAAGRSLGVTLSFVDVRDPAGFNGAFAAMSAKRAEALLVLEDSLFFAQRARLSELATKHRLPAMYAFRRYAEAGGLMSYGADFADMFRRAAFSVDKILRGAKPADLPVEQPTKFELVINLKAAKALGLTIPQSVLGRADEVIQ